MKVIVTVGETFLFVEENEVFGLEATVILKESDLKPLSDLLEQDESALKKIFLAIQGNLAEKNDKLASSGELTRAEQDFLLGDLYSHGELGVRTFSVLKAMNVVLLWQTYLYSSDAFLKFRNFGRKSLGEFKIFLAESLPSINDDFDEFGKRIRALNEIAMTFPIESFSDLATSAEFVSFRGDFENEKAVESMSIKYFLKLWSVDSTKYPLKPEANPIGVELKLKQVQKLAIRVLGLWIFQRL